MTSAPGLPRVSNASATAFPALMVALNVLIARAAEAHSPTEVASAAADPTIRPKSWIGEETPRG